MLVIERTLGSTLRIGSDIRIKVTEIPGSRRVRLGLDVPKGTLIWREEAGAPENIRPALQPKAVLRVLIVEDDAGHARLIEKGFERAGSAVTLTVDNAADAEELLQRTKGTAAMPNLILADLNLGIGQTDGVELIDKITQDETLRAIPTVMLSGVATAENIGAAFSAGVNAFLAKTDDYTEFSNLIIRVAEFWRQNLPPRPMPLPGAGGDAKANGAQNGDA
ncbi:MAG: response regulator [Planctomycetota bacterium]